MKTKYIFLFLLTLGLVLFTQVVFPPDVSALTREQIGDFPFKRGMSVMEWGGAFNTKEKIDAKINELAYMNVDAMFMVVRSEYFEAVRDPSRASWDARASWNMLEYAIEKAHSKNIQLHVATGINIAGSSLNAERKLWGTAYHVVNSSGAKDSVRLEMANPIVKNYELEKLKFIAQHYPTLDGLHLEEPFYTLQSYSPEIVARVKAKYNAYNIMGKNDWAKIECRGSSLKGIDQTICPTFSKIYSVERDVFIEFFTEARAIINANKANPNLQFSTNAQDSYRPLHGFDPEYMSDNYLIDWYLAQTATDSLSNWKSAINNMLNKVNEIPTIGVAFVTWSSFHKANPSIANPAFMQEIAHSCEYGNAAEYVFADVWALSLPTTGTKTKELLHNLPPSVLCGNSTTVSTPSFSPAPGTYPSPKSVTISTLTTGAEIRYTIDGTTPTETSPIYSTPINISTTTTFQAKAWKTGLNPSSVSIAKYTITTNPTPTPTPGIIPTYTPTPIPAYNLTLSSGWNQISSPVAEGIDISTIENSCVIVLLNNQKLWGWDAQTRSWINSQRVEPGKGYWINAARACTVTLPGTPATSTSVQLYTGWNKISASGSLNNIKGTCNVVDNKVWNWDAVNRSWTHPLTIQSDKGYWIRVTGNCTLQ